MRRQKTKEFSFASLFEVRSSKLFATGPPPRWRLASKASTISSFANYRGAQLWHSATNARDARGGFSSPCDRNRVILISSDIRRARKEDLIITTFTIASLLPMSMYAPLILI